MNTPNLNTLNTNNIDEIIDLLKDQLLSEDDASKLKFIIDSKINYSFFNSDDEDIEDEEEHFTYYYHVMSCDIDEHQITNIKLLENEDSEYLTEYVYNLDYNKPEVETDYSDGYGMIYSFMYTINERLTGSEKLLLEELLYKEINKTIENDLIKIQKNNSEIINKKFKSYFRGKKIKNLIKE